MSLTCNNCANRRALGGMDCDTSSMDPGCDYYRPFVDDEDDEPNGPLDMYDDNSRGWDED